MKKIAIIPPIPLTLHEHNRRFERYQIQAGAEVEVDIRQLKGGPLLTDSEYDLFWASVYMILEAEEAEREGFDAVIIDCTADSGIAEMRQSVSIPVVGALEAGLEEAFNGNSEEKVSILALDDDWKRMITRQLAIYNLLHMICSVECVGLHVYHPDKEKGKGKGLDKMESRIFFQKLCRAGEAAKAAGAGVVILGSTTVIAEREELEKYLGIRVVDPGAAALRKAKCLLKGNRLKKEFAAKKMKKMRYGEVIRKKLGL
ncbi:MAG: aspartate/glutamate racemase family protein [Spirochaetia bacterium]|nr:aspartate/glutamate racemase family protein [Spirochaetia bacterium]